jgi:N-acetylglutamate synthase-like GNAT family acetyltransferase
MTERAEIQWIIRKATRSDAEAIVSFLDAQNRPKRSEFVFSEYFVAETVGEIIGCGAARRQGQRGYFYGLAVATSCRRRGIGHALTQYVLDWLRTEGVEAVFALVMFWNVRFMKQHGFELVDKQVKAELRDLHPDFVDKWAARSTLMVINGAKYSLP